jgi:protein-disulfide isomerase
MRWSLALAAAALSAATATSLAAPARKAAAPAARDWTRMVAPTPEGGFRVGNPAAPVKLIEYGSLTCGACGRFAREGAPQLMARYVKSGRVSFEFRNYVRDPLDLTGALLSRCAGPARYFQITDRIFADQQAWAGKVQGIDQTALQSLPRDQQLQRLAALSGFEAIAVGNGLPAARVRQCVADEKAVAQLVGMNKVAQEKHQLQGTPTFLINGQKAPVYDWAGLEPLLKPGG